jgi:cytochrome P450
MFTDGTELVDPASYGLKGVPHDIWTRLRREAPLHYFEPTAWQPFWAVTRHADICEISRRPNDFLSAPGIVLPPLEAQDRGNALESMRTIITMDPPEHRAYRKVASPHFTPRAMDRYNPVIEAAARELVDGLAGEGEADFATVLAAAHPLRILCHILGIPREDEPTVLRLTNQLFAFDDPDLAPPGEDRDAAFQALALELYQLFVGIIEDRKANPREDLFSLYAHAKIDGEPMGPTEIFGYCLITFTAGHDTTKNSITGGLRALLENPDQLAALRDDPGLTESAVEEIIRWAAPVNYMMRTASRDLELSGQKIRKGDQLILFYASANRDEDVFDDPFAFRIDRDPNPHLSFGFGEHFCLGTHLARRSQRALFRELAGRIEYAELAGEPEQIHSSFVVGLKRLPVRYKIK